MLLKTFVAENIANIIKKGLNILKLGRGEAAPGLIALSIDSNFIAHKHQDLDLKILITGTNGKTTTTNLISQILIAQNISHLTNLNGSNLERGVASSFIGKKLKKTVLWECDEAAFSKIAPQVKPTHIIITNLFRDQLDRYGEINTTLKKWLNTLSNLPKTTLILNGNDPSLVYLGQKLENHQVIYFGLKSSKTSILKHSADTIFCPNCNKKLNYSHVNFSHLGFYSCSCNFKTPNITYLAHNLSKNSLYVNSSLLKTKLEGDYNFYNISAAYSLANILNFKLAKVIKTINNFQPVEGRQEKLIYKNKTIQFYLVKNPTGFDQVIETLKNQKSKLTLCLALNDNLADGKDISWIWDVDFESLNGFCKKIIVTGSRNLDLALRLKYAGFDPEVVTLKPNLAQAIKVLLHQPSEYLYILPTYTALWEIKKIINSSK